MAAVGVLAGIAVAYARTPLQMPGHKVLWWMIPVLASRILNPVRAGATTGAFATAIITLSLGGRIAGGMIMTPLIIVAGIVLDLAANFNERHNLSVWRRLLFFALAGAAGNLLCFIKRLFDPMGAFFSAANQLDLLRAAGSYAIFGFFAGLLGGVIAFGLVQIRARLGKIDVGAGANQ